MRAAAPRPPAPDGVRRGQSACSDDSLAQTAAPAQAPPGPEELRQALRYLQGGESAAAPPFLPPARLRAAPCRRFPGSSGCERAGGLHSASARPLSSAPTCFPVLQLGAVAPSTALCRQPLSVVYSRDLNMSLLPPSLWQRCGWGRKAANGLGTSSTFEKPTPGTLGW